LTKPKKVITRAKVKGGRRMNPEDEKAGLCPYAKM
jgi:hypothetical protein